MEIAAKRERVKKEEVATPTFLEVYPLNPPYAFAATVKDPATGGVCYQLIEPELSEQESEAFESLKEILYEELDVSLSDFVGSEQAIGVSKEAENYILQKSRAIIRKYKLKVSPESLEKLMYYVLRDFLGFGRIDGLMRDPNIEDVSCNGPALPVYVWHRMYESIPTNVCFEREEELRLFAVRLAYMSGRHISLARPMVDATLPDGSRIQITYGKEVSQKGSSFTIRKFRTDPLTITDLVRYNTISSEVAAYLWYMIENRVSVLIAGGIAAGKTTTLNVLAMFIQPDLKIVSIEDTQELRLLHENWLSQVTRMAVGTEEMKAMEIGLFDLLKAAVRQRPDYIIVGEIRGSEAYTLFQAMATGHLGMCTIHGESLDAVIRRLETEPMNISRTLITSLDLVAVQRRVPLGDKVLRRIVGISEIVGIDPATHELITNEVFRWDAGKDDFHFTGRSYRLEEVVMARGLSTEGVFEELRRRKAVIDWMVDRGIRYYKDVNRIIRDYYADPLGVYRRAMLEKET